METMDIYARVRASSLTGLKTYRLNERYLRATYGWPSA